MKKQLIENKSVKLVVPLILVFFLSACTNLPPKPYVKDFQSNYVVKPISKTATMPDSAWLASHMKGFDPLPSVSEILFSKRLNESITITQPAMADGNLAGANFTLVNEHYTINATVRLKPLNDMYCMSISVHVNGYDIGQPDQYFKGFEITPKYRVNNGLEYLLTSLASNYDVFEDDLDGYKISQNDKWIDQKKINNGTYRETF